MKRSEFLKRFGLGVAAAVAAPALLKGEPNELSGSSMWIKEPPRDWGDYCPPNLCTGTEHRCKDCGGWKRFTYETPKWKSLRDGHYSIDIPPLKEGKYKYELTFDDKLILSGNIKAK